MRKILIAGLMATATTAIAAPAQASCFYNQSEMSIIGIKLDCGWFCSNEWKIRKGDYNCRGGEGGQFWADATGRNEGHYLSGDVEDHGYVTVTGSCATGIRVQVWSKDHRLRRDLSAPGPLGQCS